MFRSNTSLLVLLLFAAAAPLVSAYAKYMCNVGKQFCTTPMVKGTTIMGGPVFLDGSRSVTVTRTPVGGTPQSLASGYQFPVGDAATYAVSLSITTLDWVIEITGAKFNAGYCTNKNRLYRDKSGRGSTDWTIVMPTTPGVTVSIWGGWAGDQVPVGISATFTLISIAAGPAPSAAPTPAPLPTLAPSLLPTPLPTVETTPAPTAVPSALPTFTPTTSAPTAVGGTRAPTPTSPPSPVPTPKPSAVPSPMPTVNPSSAAPSPLVTLSPSPEPSATVPQPSPAPGTVPIVPVFEANLVFNLATAAPLDGPTMASWLTPPFNAAPGLIAKAVGVQPSSVVVVSIRQAHRRLAEAMAFVPFLSRGLQASSYIITVQVVGLASSGLAQQAATAGAAYLSSSFAADFNAQTGSSSLTKVSVVSSSVPPPPSKDQFQFSCPLNNHLVLSWSVGNDGGVTAQLFYPSRSIWISAGIVADGETGMVSSNPASPNNVFLYAPNDPPFVGYYSMIGKTSSTIVLDTTPRTGGIVSVQSSSSGGSMVWTIPANTGVDSDTQLVVDDHNTLIWANGGEWPDQHPDDGFGFTNVYWSAGNCKGIPPQKHPSPAFVFLLLLFLCLLNSAYSPLSRLQLVKKLNSTYLPLTGYLGLGLESYSLGGIAFVLLYLVLNVVVFFVGQAQSKTKGLQWTYITISSGTLAIMNLWVTIIPTSKTSIVNKLTGVPFERAVKYHKLAVGFTLLWSTVHLCANYYANFAIFFSSQVYGASGVVPVYGLAAFAVFCSMSLMALEPVRRFNYEYFRLFHHLHWVGVALVIFHAKGSGLLAMGFVPGLLLQVIDTLRKWYRWLTPAASEATCYLNGDFIELVVPMLDDARFGAWAGAFHSTTSKDMLGQYYFINIAAVSQAQWHPFSLAYVEREKRLLHFYIRNMGLWSWTQNLAEVITRADRAHTLASSQGRAQANKSLLHVSLDGPYGSLSLDPDGYTSLTLVAGGIGITPMLHCLHTIVLHRSQSDDEGGEGGKSRPRYSSLKSIKLVWVLREAALLDVFAPRLGEILDLARSRAAADAKRLSHFATFSPLPAQGGTPGAVEMSKLTPPPPPPPSLAQAAAAPYDQVPLPLSAQAKSYGESSAADSAVQIHIYLTRKAPRDVEADKAPHPDLRFFYARPDVVELVKQTKTASEQEAEADAGSQKSCLAHCSAAILACGPAPLTDAVKHHSILEGVDCHVETFAF